jgi:hypothetical protein
LSPLLSSSQRKPQKKHRKTAVNKVDAFSSQAARLYVGRNFKNVITLIHRANGYINQLGSCGMSGRPVSAVEYFQMLYKELSPQQANLNHDSLPIPVRPQTKPVPQSVRRIFPDMEPATIRQQLTESRYDFSASDFVKVTDMTSYLENTDPTNLNPELEVAGRYIRTLYMNRLPERTGPLWLQPL